MKTAISLPDEIFDRVNVAAKELGVSRSQFFVQAAERWLSTLDEDQTTGAINQAIADLPADDEFVRAAAANIAQAD